MNRLRDMDTGFGVHVYRKPDLALVLGETGQRLDRTLSSLVAANVLVRAARGVYAFAWSAHLGEATLHTVARRLRPPTAGVGEPGERAEPLGRDQPDPGGSRHVHDHRP